MCTFFYELTITTPSNLNKTRNLSGFLFSTTEFGTNLDSILHLQTILSVCVAVWLNHVIAPISGNMECILQWSPPPSRCTLQPNASAINSQFVNNKCFCDLLAWVKTLNNSVSKLAE